VKRIMASKQDVLRFRSYDDVRQKCHEVRTLLRLRGAPCQRNIMQMHEFFWDGEHLDLVLELLPHGTEATGPPLNLYSWLHQQTVFSEEQAKIAARSILSGLKAMHDANIVHRDIKETNILFRDVDDLSTLKICDFGLARSLSPDSRWDSSRTSTTLLTARGFCGTPGYIAPEVYGGSSYGTSVDLFSFGVVLYRTLSFDNPWPLCNCFDTFAATITLNYDLDTVGWQHVSESGRRLVRGLLADRSGRYTASSALNHRWFEEVNGGVLSANRSSYLLAEQASDLMQSNSQVSFVSAECIANVARLTRWVAVY
jgi:calcium/calmodulin-dependent protein kinase I